MANLANSAYSRKLANANEPRISTKKHTCPKDVNGKLKKVICNVSSNNVSSLHSEYLYNVMS